MRTAAIYARISDARDGDTAGVDRQVKDCQALADERGWTVVGTYVDNDVSAYSGKRRPAYEDMLAAVDRGEIDVILAYSADRVYRRIKDLERLVDKLGRVGVVTIKSGDVDLSTADGRMTARILGSVGQRESEKTGERISRAYADRAARGGYPGGTRRFGYTKDGRRLVEDEAEVLRRAYRHIADGKSLRSLVLALRDEGVVGTKGAAFTATQLREGLLRPMNAGHTVHQGQILYGASDRPTIVSPELWEQVRAILLDPARKTTRGRPVKSLLSGIAHCGKCGGPLRASGKSGRRRTYRCNANYCATRDMATLDRFVTEAVLARLESSRDVIEAANSERSPEPPTEAMAEAGRLRSKLDSLSDLLTSGDLDPADYATATRKLRASLAAVEKSIASATATPAAKLLDAEDIHTAWETASVEDRRTLVKAILVDVTVSPIGSRGPGPSTDGINLEWSA